MPISNPSPEQTRTPPTRPRRSKYQGVGVNTLRIGSVLPFQLFTNIDGEFLLYRRENLPYGQIQYDALIDNSIEVVYIAPDDLASYWDYIRSGISSLLQASDGSISEKSEQFYRSSEDVTRQIMNSPVDENSVSAAQALVAEAVRFQHEGRVALHSLMEIMKTDPDIFSHSLNVCQYGLAIAQEYGFQRVELEAIGIGMLLQDLGMLDVPENLVMKSGPLSFEEWDLIKRHPAASLAALEQVPDIPELARDIVIYHHERLDGSGYPHGLSGDDLALHVRIASVADAFTTLTTSIGDKPANTTFDALRIMNTEMQGQFDTGVLTTFIKVLCR